MAALALALGLSREARATSAHGAALPDGATKVEGDQDRFKSKEDWDKTLRFFHNAYGKQAGIVWRSIASTPKVRAIHIANIKRGRSWEGINVYETNGAVFIYVIKAEPEEKTKR
ncbi:MAG: hypothetical protein IT384_02385 [Deltaproteobacteria bacterium]|nr:hypothetical protein [Deltaproteobacteria bacterium]